jgi:2-amino-4-hydroxy-6-hydroxymethyldihydropteridine diphosphokinase
MAIALVSLGSNLGDRRGALDTATAAIRRLPGTRLIARSAWRPSQSVGGPEGQPVFLNGVVRLETNLAAESLLGHLLRIEGEGGRTRDVRWEPRTLDLDLLLYGEVRTLQVPGPRSSTALRLPHPRLVWRPFILRPAAQVAAWMPHPECGWTLGHLERHSRCGANCIVIAGESSTQVHRWTNRLADLWGLTIASDLGDALRNPGDRSPVVVAGQRYLGRGEAAANLRGRWPRLLLGIESTRERTGGRLGPAGRTMPELAALGPVAWLGLEPAQQEATAHAAVESLWPELRSPGGSADSVGISPT